MTCEMSFKQLSLSVVRRIFFKDGTSWYIRIGEHKVVVLKKKRVMIALTQYRCDDTTGNHLVFYKSVFD